MSVQVVARGCWKNFFALPCRPECPLLIYFPPLYVLTPRFKSVYLHPLCLVSQHCIKHNLIIGSSGLRPSTSGYLKLTPRCLYITSRLYIRPSLNPHPILFSNTYLHVGRYLILLPCLVSTRFSFLFHPPRSSSQISSSDKQICSPTTLVLIKPNLLLKLWFTSWVFPFCYQKITAFSTNNT